MERFISLERCRKILEPKVSLSDENLAALREQLYSLAELILDIRDRKQNSVLAPGAFAQFASSYEDPEVLRERAAIIEFDGNISRDEAERMAIGLSLASEHVN